MSGDGAVPEGVTPELAERNRLFWSDGATGRLHVPYCEQCARWVLPLEPNCPRCECALGARPVSGDATVFTYTVNHHPFNPAIPTPYVIAIVELTEQQNLRMATNIVDCKPDSVRIGMPVVARHEPGDPAGDAVLVPVFAPRDGR